MTPDLLYDQLIGMGAARRLVFSYGGNPGVGSLHRFRDAIEHDWPHPVEIEEHSHAGMANRYVAGAAHLPCTLMRGYRGTDLMSRTNVATVTCPFTGEELTAVPALRPDVAIVHAQEADRQGNVQLWGIPGVQKEAILAADRSLVTVERLVEEIELRPGGIVIPGWVIDAVASLPRRLAPVLQPRHHRPRQRLLPLLGRAEPRPRRVRELDERERAQRRRRGRPVAVEFGQNRAELLERETVDR